ncbi:4-hydroxythreonine-4-phosphate dehydrogenase [Dysgonomonas sp. PH5-45]|uniref:4-hydroxythreonine-4-phosphate dehydrogenase PdxA n=1 Tax=unclassified Dysgonomonas TaxID=2630389 RepID=UPI0024755847|nr:MULTISPECIES: 4-hydroxythreonine-4-phosphate dehydrogenase PdxA [unclassified Dysgonomonas]MDH6354914.1 4-hydroxythreonine-4-phosphate dehydrogenase [Dysgonomonas sp. PH5-45]MDH6387813.1 4-hydroxythreonine-4-phosphate dehydrogenase [Dysgonomonas sp. PH5-37]
MIKVGITHGDINGIGYEVILKTFADAGMTELCVPVIYGSTKVAAYHRKALELPPVAFNLIQNAADASFNKVNIINCVPDDIKVDLGKSAKAAGDSSLAALERATADLKEGLIDVLVTAPINKDNIQQDGFQFPGHTEYLENKFAGQGQKSLMILAKDDLRIALVTGHLPFAQVPSNITKEKIVDTISVFEESLKRDFRIGKPRIAVLSLNPHAGENGLLGTEENDIIKPALDEASAKGTLCFGPYAADGFFGSGYYKKFDGIIAMYHDQGLAPFKTLAMEDGVNFTAGLPIIRTSPAHGTAYNIAGKNEASEVSFRYAIYMAIDTYNNRKDYEKAYANPLRKLYHEKGGDNEVLDLTKEDNED